MSNALKPCPFCGNNLLDMKEKKQATHRWYFVGCPKCGAIGPARFSNKEAVSWWNKVRINDDVCQADSAEPVAWKLEGGGAPDAVTLDKKYAYIDPLRDVIPLYAMPKITKETHTGGATS